MARRQDIDLQGLPPNLKAAMGALFPHFFGSKRLSCVEVSRPRRESGPRYRVVFEAPRDPYTLCAVGTAAAGSDGTDGSWDVDVDRWVVIDMRTDEAWDVDVGPWEWHGLRFAVRPPSRSDAEAMAGLCLTAPDVRPLVEGDCRRVPVLRLDYKYLDETRTTLRFVVRSRVPVVEPGLDPRGSARWQVTLRLPAAPAGPLGPLVPERAALAAICPDGSGVLVATTLGSVLRVWGPHLPSALVLTWLDVPLVGQPPQATVSTMNSRGVRALAHVPCWGAALPGPVMGCHVGYQWEGSETLRLWELTAANLEYMAQAAGRRCRLRRSRPRSSRSHQRGPQACTL